MAKKKEEKQEQPKDKTAELMAKIAEIEQTLESFRTSFKNFDTALALLKDRNRLR
jgi:hypothetical protein